MSFLHAVAVHRQHIEGAELDFLAMPAGVQSVEIGDAIDTQGDGLAIEHNGVGKQNSNALNMRSYRLPHHGDRTPVPVEIRPHVGAALAAGPTITFCVGDPIRRAAELCAH